MNPLHVPSRHGPIAFERIPDGYSINCPACGIRRALRPPAHSVTISNGRPTVSARISCPTPNCGWHARITNGRVTEITDHATHHAFRFQVSA